MLARGKVQRSTLTRRFVRTFTETLAGEQFNAGDTIPSEGEIADRFGISRTIVREGMREISALGLITKRQGARSTVAPMENWDLLNKHLLLILLNVDGKRQEILRGLLSLRLGIECQAAVEAALHADQQDLARMETQLAVMARSLEDQERFLQADDQLHRAVHAATHNVIFISTLKNIREVITIARSFTIVKLPAQHVALGQHRQLVRRIGERDPDGAHAAMKEHILWAGQGIRRRPRHQLSLPLKM